MIKTMKIKKENMKKATKDGFMNATDVADYLVKKGVAFRSAHEVVGKMVLYCVQHNKTIEDLTLEEFKTFSRVFTEDILEAIKIENCISSKKSQGSPKKQNVEKMILSGKKFIEALEGNKEMI
jgi:argininosuccinate lyase